MHTIRWCAMVAAWALAAAGLDYVGVGGNGLVAWVGIGGGVLALLAVFAMVADVTGGDD